MEEEEEEEEGERPGDLSGASGRALEAQRSCARGRLAVAVAWRPAYSVALGADEAVQSRWWEPGAGVCEARGQSRPVSPALPRPSRTLAWRGEAGTSAQCVVVGLAPILVG